MAMIAVVDPGVYSPPALRVFEAIDAAGGATEDGDVRQLNLAARIADGQKLVVPSRSQAAVPLREPRSQRQRPPLPAWRPARAQAPVGPPPRAST